MGNPSLGVPIIYLSLVGNTDYLEACGINTNVALSNKETTPKALSTGAILKWTENYKMQKLYWTKNG